MQGAFCTPDAQWYAPVSCFPLTSVEYTFQIFLLLSKIKDALALSTVPYCLDVSYTCGGGYGESVTSPPYELLTMQWQYYGLYSTEYSVRYKIDTSIKSGISLYLSSKYRTNHRYERKHFEHFGNYLLWLVTGCQSIIVKRTILSKILLRYCLGITIVLSRW